MNMEGTEFKAQKYGFVPNSGEPSRIFSQGRYDKILVFETSVVIISYPVLQSCILWLVGGVFVNQRKRCVSLRNFAGPFCLIGPGL